MSAVLRKKIKAAGGVPPSVRNMHAFWDCLSGHLDEWGASAFKKFETLTMGPHRAVGGERALELINQHVGFCFSGFQSPGLVAIAFDLEAAAQNGAARMGQDAESLKSGSPLFLRLLLEETVSQIWARMSRDLPDHDEFAAETVIATEAMAAGAFEADVQYVLVPFELGIGGRTAKIWIIMALNYLRDHAKDRIQRARENTGQQDESVRKVLRESVRTTHVVLDVVLDRMTLTLGDCSRLEVGQMVPLLDANPGQISLSAKTVKGDLEVGHGSMGVFKRHRALKLETAVPPRLVNELADL